MTAGRNEWVRDQFTVRAINYVDKHRKLHGPRRVCNHCEAAGVARPQSYSMQTTVPNLIKHFKKHRSVLAEFTRLFPVIIDDSDDIDQCSVVSSTTFSSSGSSRGSGSDMSTYHPPSKRQRQLDEAFTNQYADSFLTQAVETFALLSLPHRLMDDSAFRALLHAYKHTGKDAMFPSRATMASVQLEHSQHVRRQVIQIMRDDSTLSPVTVAFDGWTAECRVRCSSSGTPLHCVIGPIPIAIPVHSLNSS